MEPFLEGVALGRQIGSGNDGDGLRRSRRRLLLNRRLIGLRVGLLRWRLGARQRIDAFVVDALERSAFRRRLAALALVLVSALVVDALEAVLAVAARSTRFARPAEVRVVGACNAREREHGARE